MKKLTKLLAGLSLVAVGGIAMSLVAAEKPGIEDVMNKAFKGKQSLVVKVSDGKASPDEAKAFLELAKALSAATPPRRCGVVEDKDRRDREGSRGCGGRHRQGGRGTSCCLELQGMPQRA